MAFLYANDVLQQENSYQRLTANRALISIFTVQKHSFMCPNHMVAK